MRKRDDLWAKKEGIMIVGLKIVVEI